MNLKELIDGLKFTQIVGTTDVALTGLAIDSREVQHGFCFAAIKGSVVDGHNYIDKAIALGATVIVATHLPQMVQSNICYLLTDNPAAIIAEMAHRYNGNPSTRLCLVGITGTNGKTTIATLLYNLFTRLGYTCGLVSTVENKIAGKIEIATHTTPDSISISKLLLRMLDAGCTHVFMESSSHAVHQNRISALQFAVGVFSNITHDHLDYHHTFNEYISVKKAFFDSLPSTAFAISNLDDKRGTIMLQNTKANKKYYSLRTLTDFKGKILENNITGLVLDINGDQLFTRIVGEFNAYNLLAVYATAICLGQPKFEVLTSLSNIVGAEGRFEMMMSSKSKKVGIVDYAHTPDALLNVLTTIEKLRQPTERVISVVGCGGNRDKSKRPIMADVACQYSDVAFFTSDNPRFENPEDILADMTAQLKNSYKQKAIVEVDRRKAIAAAVAAANPGDIILIAGKGHEKYQDINGVKHHFDDKEELALVFKNFEA